MAKYVIDDSTMIGIAEEVRSISGEADGMTPTQMREKLELANSEIAMQQELIVDIFEALDGKTAGGGGGGDNSMEDGLLMKMLTEYSNDRVTSVGEYAFYGCKSLASVNLPLVTSVGDNAFGNTYALNYADFALVTNIKAKAFNQSALKHLILRNKESVCTLANSNAIANSSGIGYGNGYIYVPRALVDSYKVATNWSAYASLFRALEDYTVDGTTTDALDESKI